MRREVAHVGAGFATSLSRPIGMLIGWEKGWTGLPRGAIMLSTMFVYVKLFSSLSVFESSRGDLWWHFGPTWSTSRWKVVSHPVKSLNWNFWESFPRTFRGIPTSFLAYCAFNAQPLCIFTITAIDFLTPFSPQQFASITRPEGTKGVREINGRPFTANLFADPLRAGKLRTISSAVADEFSWLIVRDFLGQLR